MGADMFGAMNKPAMAKTQTPVQGQMAGGGGGNPNAMGQGFAQQAQPMSKDPFQQRQQMRANPIMQGKPGMSQSFGQKPLQIQGQGQQANPFMSGMMQSINKNAGTMGPAQLIAKQQQEQEQQAQGLGPSVPAYQQLQQNLQAQRGGLKTPYDQQQEQLQTQQQAAASPMKSPTEAAAEQMRGYEGPDLGSQDPREIARTQGRTQLYGTTPNQGLAQQQTPPAGEMGALRETMGAPMGSPPGVGPSAGGLEDLMMRMGGTGYGQPDVMQRHPYDQAQPMQMDENGLEPRRGPR